MSASVTSLVSKDCEKLDTEGDSPLLVNAVRNFVGICEALLDAGADVEKRDHNGHTALMCAAMNGSTELVTLLLNYGANPNAIEEKTKATSMFYAIAFDEFEAFKILLKRGADLHMTLRKKENCFHLIAAKGNVEMCKALIEFVSPTGLQFLLTSQDKSGNTPLHLAASKGCLEICKLLIDAGADVDATDGQQLTPLHDAAMRGHLAICKLLVENDADIDVTDRDNDTPLHLAGSKGHQDIFDYLIEKEADTKIENDDGELAKVKPKLNSDALKYLGIMSALMKEMSK